MDERLTGEVFTFIRRLCLKREAGGPVHRDEVYRCFGQSEATDAALSVLLLQHRILAFQRNDSWAYALGGQAKERLDRGEVLQLLWQAAGSEVMEQAEREPAVFEAAHEYFQRNPPSRKTLAQAYHDGSIGVTMSPGRALFENVDRVDLEHHQDGSVRFVRAR